MYDVEKLVSVVCDYLDAEADYKKYSLDVRKELGLAPDSPLWIPSLNGSKAYRLGELSEKSGATGSILADICAMLDINQELLVAAVKSMQRKERHNGRWDNPNYRTLSLASCVQLSKPETSALRSSIKEKIMKFLICMPTGKDGIQDDAVIRNALLTAVNRITLMDEKSGEFEAGDGNQNMVTFEVSE